MGRFGKRRDKTANLASYYEKCPETLEQVGGLDEPDLSYEFHVLGVWRYKPTGDLYWTTDSGCSCPSPFEDDYFYGPEDTSLDCSKEDLRKAIADFPCDEISKRQLRELCGL